jgi:hypothetical protein
MAKTTQPVKAPLLLIFVLALLLVWILATWIGARDCHSRWRGSGFQTSFNLLEGCLVSQDGKTFIPDDHDREFKVP